MTVASARVAPSEEFVDQMVATNSTLEQIDIEGLDWRFDVIAIEDSYIDHDYQRPLDERWLKAREDDFKPWLLNCVTVSERPQKKTGKRHSFVDGQHRRELALRAKITHLPAVVFRDLTQADEAALFSGFQQERRNITPFQRFKADLTAGQPRAKAILKVIKEEGFEFAEGTAAPNRIKAVAACEKMYETDPALLRTVLRLVRLTWLDLPFNTNERTLRGMSLFVQNNPDFDEARFVDRCSRVTPAVLLDRAAKLREGRGASGTLPSYMAEATANQYQKLRGR